MGVSGPFMFSNTKAAQFGAIVVVSNFIGPLINDLGSGNTGQLGFR